MTVPIDEGFLPIFSVASEAEARMLLVVACPKNVKGEYVAMELAEEQTLDNLYSFGERLRRIHDAETFKRFCEYDRSGEDRRDPKSSGRKAWTDWEKGQGVTEGRGRGRRRSAS